ncbi:MAG TPA: hypothetical protein VFF03_16405 [Rhodocyclaceae bacterium]|nr:hypothetical protein [Rhodocyclaceae bacterium]
MKNEWLRVLDECLGQSGRNWNWSAYQSNRARLLDFLASADVSDGLVEARLVEMADYYDGFVREVAVRMLGAARSEGAFRVLVRRRNDWVPQVREAAVRSSAKFVAPERGDLLLDCLELILAVARGARGDHALFVAQVDDALRAPENRDKVLCAFGKARGGVARHLLSILLALPDDHLAAVFDVAVGHADFTVRSMLLRECGRRDVPEELSLLVRLIADPQPRIRKGALQLLWEKHQESGALAQALERCLFDPAAAVREFVLWCRRGQGWDVAARVREQLAAWGRDARADVAAIGLIGTLKASEHLARVQEAFADKRPAIHRAALVAWASLDRATADVPVMAALTDVSGKVYKVALCLVRKGRVALSNEQLRSAARVAAAGGDSCRHVVILQLLPFWDRLEACLEATPHIRTAADEAQIVAALKTWGHCQRYAFSSLPTERQAAIRAAVAQGSVLALWRRRPDLGLVLAQFGVALDQV